MLCNSCLRQQACLTHQLALNDQNLRSLLSQLQRCEMRMPPPTVKPRQSWQWLPNWVKEG